MDPGNYDDYGGVEHVEYCLQVSIAVVFFLQFISSGAWKCYLEEINEGKLKKLRIRPINIHAYGLP